MNGQTASFADVMRPIRSLALTVAVGAGAAMALLR